MVGCVRGHTRTNGGCVHVPRGCGHVSGPQGRQVSGPAHANGNAQAKYVKGAARRRTGVAAVAAACLRAVEQGRAPRRGMRRSRPARRRPARGVKFGGQKGQGRQGWRVGADPQCRPVLRQHQGCSRRGCRVSEQAQRLSQKGLGFRV